MYNDLVTLTFSHMRKYKEKNVCCNQRHTAVYGNKINTISNIMKKNGLCHTKGETVHGDY